MPITVQGLDKIKRNFEKFEFTGKRVEARFLRLIGEMTVELLRNVTPVDQGDLQQSWRIVGQGKHYVEVGTSLIGLVEQLSEGTSPHLIEPKNGKVLRFEKGGQEVFATRVFHPGTRPNPFLDDVGRIINNQVIQVLQQALSENHPFFANLRDVGGKGRKFQQVGRTSAGFKGGVSFAGRSTLVRGGTGRRQLKRKTTLRRPRGRSILSKDYQKRIKLG